MSLTLYHGQPNGPSLTVLATLFEKEVEADLVAIDLAAGERHRLSFAAHPEVAMSIEGEGPVLVAGGEPMTDSLFIACYLDQVGKGPALRPADPYQRWEMMMICRRMTERVDPAAALLGCQAYLVPQLEAVDDAAFASLASSIHSEDLRARWVDFHDGRIDPAQVEDSRSKIAAAIESSETTLATRPYLMGDFGIADLVGYASMAGMVGIMADAFAAAPRTTAWLDRIRDRPAVARALSLATGGDPAQAWAPGPEINRWG